MNTALNEFLAGFAAGAQIPFAYASEQWAGFSYQLTDEERRDVESGGYKFGEEQGREFLALYPDTDSVRLESAPDHEETFREDVLHGESCWGF